MIPLARAAGVSDFGLLLYPRKQLGLGKTMVNDESIILDAAEMRALSKALRSLKRSAQDTAPLWSFTQAVFYERFHTCCRMAGLQQTVHSYQVRHGAASEDALSKRRTLAEKQERLRHSADAATKRYRNATGYLAELHKVGHRVTDFGLAMERDLAAVFEGKKAPLTPPTATRSLVRVTPSAAAVCRQAKRLGSA